MLEGEQLPTYDETKQTKQQPSSFIMHGRARPRPEQPCYVFVVVVH